MHMGQLCAPRPCPLTQSRAVPEPARAPTGWPGKELEGVCWAPQQVAGPVSHLLPLWRSQALWPPTILSSPHNLLCPGTTSCTMHPPFLCPHSTLHPPGVCFMPHMPTHTHTHVNAQILTGLTLVSQYRNTHANNAHKWPVLCSIRHKLRSAPPGALELELTELSLQLAAREQPGLLIKIRRGRFFQNPRPRAATEAAPPRAACIHHPSRMRSHPTTTTPACPSLTQPLPEPPPRSPASAHLLGGEVPKCPANSRSARGGTSLSSEAPWELPALLVWTTLHSNRVPVPRSSLLGACPKRS